MKALAILVLTLLSNIALAVSPDSEMNDELIVIYDTLTSQKDSSRLLGKEYIVKLSLKHASETHLIFSDTYIRVDEDTKYQLAKWRFNSHIVDSIKGKHGISCNVTFIIKSIENQGVNKDMPYIVVEVLNINT